MSSGSGAVKFSSALGHGMTKPQPMRVQSMAVDQGHVVVSGRR